MFIEVVDLLNVFFFLTEDEFDDITDVKIFLRHESHLNSWKNALRFVKTMNLIMDRSKVDSDARSIQE